ncbi:MAG: VCBS domain-containing protein, partial [Clostridia bacterium]|nr:VCBS domain-containing protein [Clostridia bacterium]
ALADMTDYTVRIMQSTLYGTFRLDKCGKCIYRAMKGYHGTDTIVLEIADGAGNKKTVTITVTVTKE